jgi:rRNA-processing protein FCF1
MPLTLSSLPKSPIADTNILFDFLLWRFHTETQTGIPEWLRDHLYSKPLRELTSYLGGAGPVQTSSQVVSEIYWLAKTRAGFRDRTLDSFWRLARLEFDQLELTEHLVKMPEMEFDDFVKYGPADASILVLAKRLDVVVLTQDGPLKDRCIEQEIRVLNYDRVLELWKQSH